MQTTDSTSANTVIEGSTLGGQMCTAMCNFNDTEEIRSPTNERKEIDRVRASPPTSLTSDILFHIFEYLPLEDRKRVRLTCKLWKECCSRISIIKTEKIVFRVGCSISDIVQVLVQSSFIRVNLEFHIPLINSLTADVWETFGHKVLEIDLRPSCQLGDETLKNIALYCTNLTCLGMWKFWGNESASEPLDYFIEKNIIRPELHTFRTSYNCKFNLISMKILKKIFSVFPSIKHFSVGNYVLEKYDSADELPLQLQSLTYNIRTDYCWFEKPTISVWQSRLTKFETSLRDVNTECMFQFFAIQKELKIINLAIGGYRERDYTKNLIFHILENCPNLREFRVKYISVLSLTTEESTKFLSLISNLKCLTIGEFRVAPLPPSFSPNLKLNTLEVFGFQTDILSKHILRCCSQVNHLTLQIVCDDMLQNIFKNLVDLESLKLNLVNGCTNYGFIGQDEMRSGGFSIKRLRRLEHLEITRMGVFSQSFNILKIAREFQSPYLKYLKLSTGFGNYNMREIMSYVTTVETLKLNCPCLGDSPSFTVEKITEFCEPLKKLKFLFVHLKKRDQKNGLESLFEACPSLRYVQILPRKVSTKKPPRVYSFNPFSKQVVLTSSYFI